MPSANDDKKPSGLHEQFLKPYNPAENEAVIYALWERSGFFNPDKCIEAGVTTPDSPYFSIVLPPPNVTGTLHMGHAAMLAIEDTFVRYHRMKGDRTLWVPGTDSAALATQSKVEEILYKTEKKTRHDLGREVFLERVKKFTEESHQTITGQIRRMGSSVDWSREAYTLDTARYAAVMTAFKRMYDAGLIFKGSRLINWDPKLQTTVSDEEIEWMEEKTNLYYLTYGPFTIATARPETKFGDKYVVMHPDDERYQAYTHGQKIELEWINGPITATIIKDDSIDKEFGTGVMTITPWHDLTDFDIAERHNLDKEQIIDFKGLLLPIAGEFSGQHIKKARPLIIEKLKAKGLLTKEEPYTHNIATNSRGGGIIEPQIKEQWFVDVTRPFTLEHSQIEGIASGSQTSLQAIMRTVVESNQITILPEYFDKTYFHWINNLRPWCISRQIWFGHRIPVWYRGNEVYCDVTPPEGNAEQAQASGWEQDPDTLDTWFSSGLWTFSTLGWPEDTADLKNYHPTNLIETGYDILFFWVARMVLMSGFLRGEVPFKTVYLHGMVRDAQGRKMSKSLGNIIDPVDMAEKYGADATRLSLIIGAAPGTDIKLSEERIRGYKNFANKIWNITRFVLTSAEGLDLTKAPELNDTDGKLLGEYDAILKDISSDLDNSRLYLAGEKIYHYIWHTFADVIIEESKPIIASADESAKTSRQQLLYAILIRSLKALHPFMPFVTEAVWQLLPNRESEFLMIAKWPQ